jgi:hypothetical protein
MADAPHEEDAESLHIKPRCQRIHQLDVAVVAGAGVDMKDPRRFAESS